jgi:hypothetical protein
MRGQIMKSWAKSFLFAVLIISLFSFGCGGGGGGGGGSSDINSNSTTTIPTEPTGVIATPIGNGNIMIAWTEVTGATSYNIYESTSDSEGYFAYTKIGSTETSSYTATGLANDIIYFLTVTAVNSAGESRKLDDLIVNATALSNLSQVKTYAVGTSAGDLAIDGSGNVWVSEDGNVIKLNSSGIVLGNYDTPGRWGGGDTIAIDGSGNVWVDGSDFHSITKLSSAGTILGTYDAIIDITDIAVDGLDNVWICDYNNKKITKLSSSGTILGTYYVGPIAPRKIVIDGSDNVWVGRDSGIIKLSSSGTILFSYGVDVTDYIAIDYSDSAWISGTMDKIDSAGNIYWGVNFPINIERGPIAIDGSGNIWVAERGNDYNYPDKVIEYTPTGTVLSTYIVNGWSRQLAIDGIGNVWVLTNGSNNITELIGVASPVKTPLVLQFK